MRLVLLRDLHFVRIFIDAIKSELSILTFQSSIVRIWAHMKPSPFCYKTNALTDWDWHPKLSLSIYYTYPTLPLVTTYPLSVCKNVYEMRDVSFFTRDWEKNNKKHFYSVEVGNDILIYINIKRVFQMEINYTHY